MAGRPPNHNESTLFKFSPCSTTVVEPLAGP